MKFWLRVAGVSALGGATLFTVYLIVDTVGQVLNREHDLACWLFANIQALLGMPSGSSGPRHDFPGWAMALMLGTGGALGSVPAALMTSMLPLQQVLGRFLRLLIVQTVAALGLATVVYAVGPPELPPHFHPCWVRRPLLLLSLGAALGLLGGLASCWLVPVTEVHDFHNVSSFMQRQAAGFALGGAVGFWLEVWRGILAWSRRRRGMT